MGLLCVMFAIISPSIARKFVIDEERTIMLSFTFCCIILVKQSKEGNLFFIWLKMLYYKMSAKILEKHLYRKMAWEDIAELCAI